jgi:hypothetical protein
LGGGAGSGFACSFAAALALAGASFFSAVVFSSAGAGVAASAVFFLPIGGLASGKESLPFLLSRSFSTVAAFDGVGGQKLKTNRAR